MFLKKVEDSDKTLTFSNLTDFQEEQLISRSLNRITINGFLPSNGAFLGTAG
jgi:hypothetical protein